jgi:PAS domain S-box-containing protein
VAAARSRLRAATVDCVVVEQTPPEGETEGLSLLRTVRQSDEGVPVVLLTGSRAVVERAVEAGVTDCRPRPEASGAGVALLARRVVDAAERWWTERPATAARYRDLVDAIVEEFPNYIFVIDTDGEYLEAVTGARGGTTGYTDEDLVGRRLPEVLSAETAEKLGTAVRETVATGERTTVEYAIEGRETSWYEANIVPLPDGYGAAAAAVVAAVEVTERRAREAKLKRQNARLERFASVVSHDLRNPIEVAFAGVELTRASGDLSELDRVETALHRMDDLVDDVLALARQGETVSDPERVSLRDLVTDCWAGVTAPTATLCCRVPGPHAVWADPGRLRQLLENLFRNAVEHGGTRAAETGVTVTVGLIDGDGEGEDEGEGAGFYVADDGSGVPPEDRSRVFEDGYSTRQAGTGLGLSIVQEIAEAHGWSVRVTDAEGGGARFEVLGVESA